jgi:hypothetical protein
MLQDHNYRILLATHSREAEYGATSQGGFEPKISGLVLPGPAAQSNSGKKKFDIYAYLLKYMSVCMCACKYTVYVYLYTCVYHNLFMLRHGLCIQ